MQELKNYYPFKQHFNFEVEVQRKPLIGFTMVISMYQNFSLLRRFFYVISNYTTETNTSFFTNVQLIMMSSVLLHKQSYTSVLY